MEEKFLVGIIGFWHNNLGIFCSEILIKKGNMSYNFQTVSNNTSFIGIAVMSVNISLVCHRSFSGILDEYSNRFILAKFLFQLLLINHSLGGL